MNSLWVDNYIRWKTCTYFQFSVCRYPVFPAALVEESIFSIVCFWHLCQKSGGNSYVDSYLGFLFCFTVLHVCFCASTMLFLLLGSGYILKLGIVIPIPNFFLFSIFLDICGLLCFQMNFKVNFQSLWSMSLEFLWELLWPCRLLLVI
jgi:hypothetical protein